MKVGDTVVISNKNKNHLGNDVCAYAGMKGIVTDVWDDNSFCLNCQTSILVVPMRNAFKEKRKGVWVELNGTLVFHKSKDAIPKSSPKKWFNWFVPKEILQ